MAQMVAAGQLRKDASVVDHSADRNAAEADAVVAALPADQARSCPLSDRALIGERNLQRRVDRFRT